MKDKYIQGIYNEYAGLLDQKLADLHILLRNPVGVAEHGSISDEIKTKIVEIDRYQSLVNTLKVLFEPSSEPPSDAAKPPSAEGLSVARVSAPEHSDPDPS